MLDPFVLFWIQLFAEIVLRKNNKAAGREWRGVVSRKLGSTRVLGGLLLLILPAIALDITVSNWALNGWLVFVFGLSLDDWLNSDDRWKRRWRAARNRLRWRMKLPSPSPA